MNRICVLRAGTPTLLIICGWSTVGTNIKHHRMFIVNKLYMTYCVCVCMCVCVHTSLHCTYVILVLMFQNYDSSSEKHITSRNHGKTGHNEQGLTPHADHARQPNVCPDFLFLATHPHSGCGPYAFLLLLLQSSIVEFFLLIFFFHCCI